MWIPFLASTFFLSFFTRPSMSSVSFRDLPMMVKPFQTYTTSIAGSTRYPCFKNRSALTMEKFS